MPDTWNFLNAMNNGAGANPVGPIDPNTPAVVTPQQHALLKALAQHIAGNSLPQPSMPAPSSSAVPPTNPVPAQPRYQVVRHPNAPARLPYAIQDKQTGGYVPGGSPIFPRLFATKAEAQAAVPSQATAPAIPSAMPAIRSSQAGGSISPEAAPRVVVRPNPDAPARFPYGRWDNQTQDWRRDRFGFAKMYGTPAEAQGDPPDEVPIVDYDTLSTNTRPLIELASQTHHKGQNDHTSTSSPLPANSTADPSHVDPRPTPSNGNKLVTIYDVYEAAKAAGDPHPAVTAAQWADESGWGAKPSGRFNYFNVKGAGTTLPTTEYVNGRKVHVRASFKNYSSLQQAIADHTRLLKTKHYAGYGAAKTDQQAVEALVRAGYATNPHYEAELLSIINKYFPSKPSENKK